MHRERVRRKRSLTRERRAFRIGTAAAVALLSVLAVFQGTPAPAQAYDVGAFNPGNIIDDALFYNGAALNATEVQQFLNQRVTRCTLGDPGRPAGGWGVVNTNAGPVSVLLAKNCLKDARFNTVSREANSYCRAYPGVLNETAAQIIAKVGSACGISPAVLLVMLEKEQSLVQDTWPSQRQFDVAMGYACPDSGPGGTAACDPSQTGFFQQVYLAAWQLQVYRAHPDNYGYRPGWNSINWQVVKLGCGVSAVHIENWATAALYIYTPYRPNAAALAAGWGTGDNCSAYGNRNFANFYRAWFGAMHLAPQVLGGLNEPVPVPGGLYVRGWAADPKSPAAVRAVQLYMGNLGWQLTANQPRPDVPLVYPQFGGSTGYAATLPGAFSGRQNICAYSAVQLGCAEVDFGVSTPRGNVDRIGVDGTQLVVKGWGVDTDYYRGSLEVHVYVGGQGFRTTANQSRPDVARVYPEYGADRGFDWKVSAAQWAGTTQSVCVYGINTTPTGALHGHNPLLKSCQDVSFPLSVKDTPPQGELESVTTINEQLTLRGWAFDSNTTGSIDVTVTINGTVARVVRANQQRPEIAATYGRLSDLLGFEANVPLAKELTNPALVCLSAANSDANGEPNGKLQQLACRTVTWIQDDFSLR